MNVLFLTMAIIESLSDSGVYTDLLRKFSEDGHSVFVVTPIERRQKKETKLIKDGNRILLNVKTLNLQKTNLIEKGLGMLLIEFQFLHAVNVFFKGVKFDLVLYSTPPITFSKIINKIKIRDKAFAYLLLKDIFPQNAVDMKMINKGSILHNYFVKKEQLLYRISDAIGCMSEANKEYIIKNNNQVEYAKIEVNPNSIKPRKRVISNAEKEKIKIKYCLPLDKKIFVYGGNLGIPQGVSFVMDTIQSTTNPNIYFLIIGSGTEFAKMERWFETTSPKNAILRNGLPKDEFELLLTACDIGMIFLHKNFTIPNFPSRLLSYLEMELPILVASDANSDIGSVVENAGCGYSVLWGDQESMQHKINLLGGLTQNEFDLMRANSWQLLLDEFHVDRSYMLIKNRLIHV